MSFLPLVERELRVAARRASGYWIRSLTAVVAVVFLLPTLAFGSGGRTAAGAVVFAWMTWFFFGIVALAGVFMGADAIAEERREGTLGFLFLTDLRGYDVVLGKFFSAALSAFYSMLAALPILAMSVYGGGVTAGEFWRVSVALLNSLFFVVALSLLISARMKSDARPVGNAFAFFLGVLLMGCVAQTISSHISSLNAAAALRWLSLLSPGQLVYLASASNYLYRAGDYWSSLGVTHAAGWAFLGLASWRLDALTSRRQTEAVAKRKRRNRKLLEVNPIIWLLDDSVGLKIGIWCLAGIGAVVTCVATFAAGEEAAGYLVTWPIILLLKLRFATQSCRFFAEGRRSGALELLRTAPFGGQKMVAGQWIALRRIFLGPIMLLVGTEFVSWVIAMTGNVSGAGNFGGIMTFYQLIVVPMDFYAIGWTGMWIALTTRNPSRAAWLTILFVVILPLVFYCVPNFLVDSILIAIFCDKVVRRLNIYLAVRQDETGYERAMIRS